MRGCLLWVAVASVLSLFTCGAYADSMDLVLFSGTEVSGARCLDGTPAGFYFGAPRANVRSRAGAGAGAVNGTLRVVIYLEGGGLCFDEGTCKERAHSALGSSKYWNSTYTSAHGILSSDCDENPLFCDAARVYLPYCSGDVFSGTRMTKGEDTFGLYFAGHLIVETLMSEISGDLSHTAGSFANIEVVLSGGSAGGIGALTHTNWLRGWADALKQKLGDATQVRVSSVPNAGFFIDAKPFVDPFGYPCHRIAGHASALYASWFDPLCASENPNQPYVCICGPAMISAVRSARFVPTFLAESQYDSEQLYVQDGVPMNNDSAPVRDYITYFGELMRSSLAPVVADNATYSYDGVELPFLGLFAPSCLTHVISWDGITAHNTTYRDTLHCWYTGSCTPKVIDDCGTLPCSPATPKCHHFA